MGYQKAMEMAGATVHEFEQFGSYQGEWFAKVTYKGKEGWVSGSYGSCSGCDAFEGEFGYVYHDCTHGEYYSPLYDDKGFAEDCQRCRELKDELVTFGEGYLDGIMSQEDAIKDASRNLDWDMDADKIVEFVKSNAITEA